MKVPILYSFVRYRPYIETGEFINVGLIMCEPSAGKFTTKIVPANNKRVKHFFPESEIFKNIQELMKDQLRFLTQINNLSGQELSRFFHGFIDNHKEGIINYSDAKVIMIESPEKYFNQIYEQYIQRAGVQTPRKEQELINQYKQVLINKNLQFKEEHIVNEVVDFRLPLAQKNSNEIITKAIKPLCFEQTDTPKMIILANKWINQIMDASDEGLVAKDKVLFPLYGGCQNVLDKIKCKLDKAGISYVNSDDYQEILKFASY